MIETDCTFSWTRKQLRSFYTVTIFKTTRDIFFSEKTFFATDKLKKYRLSKLKISSMSRWKDKFGYILIRNRTKTIFCSFFSLKRRNLGKHFIDRNSDVYFKKKICQTFYLCYWCNFLSRQKWQQTCCPSHRELWLLQPWQAGFFFFPWHPKLPVTHFFLSFVTGTLWLSRAIFR